MSIFIKPVCNAQKTAEFVLNKKPGDEPEAKKAKRTPSPEEKKEKSPSPEREGMRRSRRSRRSNSEREDASPGAATSPRKSKRQRQRSDQQESRENDVQMENGEDDTRRIVVTKEPSPEKEKESPVKQDEEPQAEQQEEPSPAKSRENEESPEKSKGMIDNLRSPCGPVHETASRFIYRVQWERKNKILGRQIRDNVREIRECFNGKNGSKVSCSLQREAESRQRRKRRLHLHRRRLPPRSEHPRGALCGRKAPPPRRGGTTRRARRLPHHSGALLRPCTKPRLREESRSAPRHPAATRGSGPVAAGPAAPDPGRCPETGSRAARVHLRTKSRGSHSPGDR